MFPLYVLPLIIYPASRGFSRACLFSVLVVRITCQSRSWFALYAPRRNWCSCCCKQKKVTFWVEKVPLYRQKRNALLEKVTN